ncbi:pyridoxamine 5'-phosphate oxidase family protein [Streptomyces beijiangensis]|uniref:Pyridoxamine 5'-phosphate oxidase family protein n=1 Tax=Streptomyces beijiangensis TaxID=163361 RepID=A0A939FDD4_9ACTN|nr:pyridoxamine 5'-phosphate oxidase family protein [Streptomyces beijiangensis]MBO0515337.1 pyridoxamine 5'-phosphate oxidase family protein [Streptomyces beijiangensis]
MSTEEIRALTLLGRLSYGRVATSMRALPFLAIARHIVTADGRVVLRMHAGLGHHEACVGSVVTYAADNLGLGDSDLWSVQFTGTAETTVPSDEELTLFEPEPVAVNGEPFEPVYMRISPQFVNIDRLQYARPRAVRNAA